MTGRQHVVNAYAQQRVERRKGGRRAIERAVKRDFHGTRQCNEEGQLFLMHRFVSMQWAQHDAIGATCPRGDDVVAHDIDIIITVHKSVRVRSDHHVQRDAQFIPAARDQPEAWRGAAVTRPTQFHTPGAQSLCRAGRMHGITARLHQHGG